MNYGSGSLPWDMQSNQYTVVWTWAGPKKPPTHFCIFGYGRGAQSHGRAPLLSHLTSLCLYSALFADVVQIGRVWLGQTQPRLLRGYPHSGRKASPVPEWMLRAKFTPVAYYHIGHGGCFGRRERRRPPLSVTDSFTAISASQIAFRNFRCAPLSAEYVEPWNRAVPRGTCMGRILDCRSDELVASGSQ